MRKIISLFLFISIFVIVTFLLFADFENYVKLHLNDTKNLFIYSMLSFVFLLSDIALPVPSSLIMILNGKVLGLLLGSFLSILAGLASSSLGFYLGRKSVKFLNRLFKEDEVDRANRFMDKYGKVSVALSRAIPILSETVAVLSGTTSMSFRTFFAYSFLGHFVVSIVYAWVGAFTSDMSGHVITVVVVSCTLLLSWGLSFYSKRKDLALKNSN